LLVPTNARLVQVAQFALHALQLLLEILQTIVIVIKVIMIMELPHASLVPINVPLVQVVQPV
jgi:hypothetical protein